MSDLVVADPYGSVYDFEKVQNPDLVVFNRVFPKWKVEAVNKLIHLAHGRDQVKSEDDWNVVANIVVFFIQCFPHEWNEFKNNIGDIRHTRNSGGYSRSKEIKYVASIPLRLERLIKTCFPHNQINKDFIYEFVKRFKIFKVGGELN